jgi:hypothetical protein
LLLGVPTLPAVRPKLPAVCSGKPVRGGWAAMLGVVVDWPTLELAVPKSEALWPKLPAVCSL